MTAPIKNYSVAEAADVLRVCIRTVFQLIRAGKLKRFKVGRRTLIREPELLRFIERGGSR